MMTASPVAMPIVYFLQYLTTVPCDSGENDDFHAPHSCAPPLLVTIKGGGGLPLERTLLDISYRGHLHSRSSPHPTPF